MHTIYSILCRIPTNGIYVPGNVPSKGDIRGRGIYPYFQVG